MSRTRCGFTYWEDIIWVATEPELTKTWSDVRGGTGEWVSGMFLIIYL